MSILSNNNNNNNKCTECGEIIHDSDIHSDIYNDIHNDKCQECNNTDLIGEEYG